MFDQIFEQTAEARARPEIFGGSCGTLAAHRRHVRHGEAPCDACRAAYNAEHRRLYAARDRGG